VKVTWKVFTVRATPALACVFLMAFFLGVSTPVAVPASSGAGPVLMGNPALPRVALMFNVDWGEEYIPDILQVLEDGRARATFFVTGTWAKKHPDLLRRIAEAGHEVGNHGYSHAHPAELDRKGIERLIIDNEALLRDVLACEPARIYAPPYGEYTEESLQATEDLGYRTILWTVDTVDWRRPPPSVVRKRASKASSGSLLLMHPTEPTKLALPGILADMKERGLDPVTVTQILDKEP
jgi:peptidoglycan/xylan/chitin deacetylase (PgdA/CDA1 family)